MVMITPEVTGPSSRVTTTRARHEQTNQLPRGTRDPAEPAVVNGAVPVAEEVVDTANVMTTRSAKDFAELINGAWRKGAEAFIAAGQFLIEAKAELDRDQFNSLIERELDFDASVARKLLCVAGKTVLRAHVHKLPPHWSTLYELSKVEDKVIDAAVADGRISPKMQREQAVALRKPVAAPTPTDSGATPHEKTEKTEKTKSTDTRKPKASADSPTMPPTDAEESPAERKAYDDKSNGHDEPTKTSGTNTTPAIPDIPMPEPPTVPEKSGVIVASTDIVDSWLKAWLNAVPQEWIPRLEQLLAERRPALDDLSVPTFFQRKSSNADQDPVLDDHVTETGDEDDQEPEQKPKRKLKLVEHKYTIADAVAEALAELSELASECRDAVDNAPENFQQTNRILTLSDAADALESIENPDIPDALGKMTVTCALPKRKRPSRQARAEDANTLLEACASVLSDNVDDADRLAAQALISDLENTVATVENCEFPGMCG
jgi:hypothetical protein